MALTRKLLKGMGLTEEQMDTIIEAHTDTVDGLKTDLARYKEDAEKLPGVQAELENLKAKGVLVAISVRGITSKATMAGRISTTKSKRNLTTTKESRCRRKPRARKNPRIGNF